MFTLPQLVSNYDNIYMKSLAGPPNDPTRPNCEQFLYSDFSFANNSEIEGLHYPDGNTNPHIISFIKSFTVTSRDHYKLLLATDFLEKKRFNHSILIKSPFNDKKFDILTSIFNYKLPSQTKGSQSEKTNQEAAQISNILKPKAPHPKFCRDSTSHKRSVSANIASKKPNDIDDNDDEPPPTTDRFYQHQQANVIRRQVLNKVYESPHVKDLERIYQIKFPADFHVPGSPTYILPLEAVENLRKRMSSSLSPRLRTTTISSYTQRTSRDQTPVRVQTTQSNYSHSETKIVKKLRKEASIKESNPCIAPPIKKNNDSYIRKRYANSRKFERNSIFQVSGSENRHQLFSATLSTGGPGRDFM